MRRTNTWKLHPLGQTLIGGHHFPTLRNELSFRVLEVHLTTSSNSEVHLIALHDMLNQRQAPSLARLGPLPCAVDSLLNAILIHNCPSNILLQHGFPLFLQGLLLFWGPLVHILHHRVGATFHGQPHVLGRFLVDTVEDRTNTVVGAQIKMVPQ